MESVHAAFGQDEVAVDALFLQPVGVLHAFIKEEVSRSDPDPGRREVGERGATRRNRIRRNFGLPRLLTEITRPAAMVVLIVPKIWNS